MRKYNIGDEVFVKAVIVREIDEDNDYYVELRDGNGDCEQVYVNYTQIFGKTTEFKRLAKYLRGDVLKMHTGLIAVISEVRDKECILTFSDGTGSVFSIEDLDKNFKHHGVSIEYELEQLLSKLKDDVA